MDSKLKKSVFIITSITLSASLILLFLYAVIMIPATSMWFYRWQYNVNNTYESIRMEPDELHRVTRRTIRYLQGRESDLQIRVYVDGTERYFFSDLELRHMEDVRALFWYGEIAMWTSLSVFIVSLLIFLLWGRRRSRIRYIFKSMLISTATVLSAMLILTIVIFANWNRAFVIFHEIFFNNDYWILDRGRDLMLTMVCYDFFINISIFIGAVFAFVLLEILALSIYFNWRLKKRKVKLKQ